MPSDSSPDPSAANLKHRLDEVLAKNAVLSGELKMMADCLAMVSHDLRTPLNFISFALDMLLQQGEERIHLENRKLVLQCQKNLDEMARLVEDLLDFGRIKAGALRLECANHDLLEIINEAITRFETLADAKGLVIHGPPNTIRGARAFCDRNRIMQILSNLLHNAIKFTDQGEILIHMLSYPDKLEVIVMDTGVGIAQEEQARIFDRFAQAGTKDSRGLGLGLYIVKRIIEHHQGTVSVESILGVGSQFRFALPRGKEESPHGP